MTRWFLLACAVSTLSLVGCSPKPLICPAGTVPWETSNQNAQCGGNAKVDVLSQDGEISALCQEQGPLTRTCLPKSLLEANNHISFTPDGGLQILPPAPESIPTLRGNWAYRDGNGFISSIQNGRQVTWMAKDCPSMNRYPSTQYHYKISFRIEEDNQSLTGNWESLLKRRPGSGTFTGIILNGTTVYRFLDRKGSSGFGFVENAEQYVRQVDTGSSECPRQSTINPEVPPPPLGKPYSSSTSCELRNPPIACLWRNVREIR